MIWLLIWLISSVTLANERLDWWWGGHWAEDRKRLPVSPSWESKTGLRNTSREGRWSTTVETFRFWKNYQGSATWVLPWSSVEVGSIKPVVELWPSIGLPVWKGERCGLWMTQGLSLTAQANNRLIYETYNQDWTYTTLSVCCCRCLFAWNKTPGSTIVLRIVTE